MILPLHQPDYVPETSVFTPAASAQTFGLGGVTGRKQVLPKRKINRWELWWEAPSAEVLLVEDLKERCVSAL